MFRLSPFDGVLGFSRRDAIVKNKAGKKVHFNLMKSAKAQKQVKKNIVSFFLGFTPGKGGGAAILGGVDQRLFTGKIKYHPVIKGTMRNWAIKMDRLYLNGSKKNFCPKAGCLGIADTGTSLIVGAGAVATPLLKNLGIKMDCSNLKGAPDMIFDFGGTKYNLKPGDYTLELMMGAVKRCQVAFKAASSRIPLSFPAHKDMPIIILGDVFLRRYYSVFNNDNPAKPMVGFALANQQVKIKSPAVMD